jgi:hypothetical protein
MSLPVLKPQIKEIEIDASYKLGHEHEKIKFTDVDIFAHVPPLDYVIERTYGLEKKDFPNVPRFLDLHLAWL